MVPWVEINEEVLYSGAAITTLAASDIRFLKEKASGNKRKRVRLCAHPDIEDRIHEMVIVHHRGNYVPPHRHVGKSESFHIVEGRLDVVIFHEDGSIRDVVRMGPFGGEGCFYYRLSESRYHTVIPQSEVVVFHESTNGPFDRKEMIFAKWAPSESAPAEKQYRYIQSIEADICEWRRKTGRPSRTDMRPADGKTEDR